MSNSHELCVTAYGMVSSLGLNAIHACAAARAGLTRPVDSEYVVLSGLDGSPEPLAVHSAPMLTDGFQGLPRLLRLAEGALQDLRSRANDFPPSAETGVYLSIGDPCRRWSDLELIADDALRQVYEEDAVRNEPALEDEDWAASIVGRSPTLVASANQPYRLSMSSVAGHTGFAEVLESASRDLQEGTIKFALVGAVDSLLDKSTLGWLDATGRLATPLKPVGLMPGEAAVFVVLESSTTASQSHRDALGTLDSVEFADEPQGNSATGKALAALLQKPLREYPGALTFHDHNGEYARGFELGSSIVELRRGGVELDVSDLEMPAIAFGDTSAASGGVAICLSLAAQERGYAKSNRSLIMSSSDSGRRSLVQMSYEHPRER